MRDEREMTPWHLVAFLGELVMWGCAAWAGWTLATGALSGVLAAVALVAIIGVWTVFAAPRAVRRLSLAPRLVFIATLGAITAGLFLPSSTWIGIGVTVASTLTVCVAQWRDARLAE